MQCQIKFTWDPTVTFINYLCYSYCLKWNITWRIWKYLASLISQNKGYLLYTENKNSSCYGKCTENDVRQPVVFRQVFWMLVEKREKCQAYKPSHGCTWTYESRIYLNTFINIKNKIAKDVLIKRSITYQEQIIQHRKYKLSAIQQQDQLQQRYQGISATRMRWWDFKLTNW